MLSRWQRGGMVVGAGLVVGLGVIGGMKLRLTEEPVVNSRGGSVLLDRSTPTPDPTALRVTEAGPGSVQGTMMSGSNGNTEAPPAPAKAPSPDDFKQYEKYQEEQNALFGEIEVGQGQEVVMGSKLTVAYRGWLTDGKLFDESYSRGAAFSFTQGEHRVISGWEQGLMGMKAGGKRRLIVPPAAGYGAEAHGPIPANSVLVFDIELLKVE